MRIIKSVEFERLIKELKKTESESMIELIAQQIYVVGGKEAIENFEKKIKKEKD